MANNLLIWIYKDILRGDHPHVYQYWLLIPNPTKVKLEIISYFDDIHGTFTIAEIGTSTSTLRFSNAEELLKVKGNPQFQVILTTVTCLNIVVEAVGDEVSQLIDLVNELKVERKSLLLKVPALDLSLMGNKTINFNVMIYNTVTGNTISTKNTQYPSNFS